MNDFLQSLAANSPILWALLVLGVVAGLSLGLYAFWEVVLRIVFRAFSRANKNRQVKG